MIRGYPELRHCTNYSYLTFITSHTRNADTHSSCCISDGLGMPLASIKHWRQLRRLKVLRVFAILIALIALVTACHFLSLPLSPVQDSNFGFLARPLEPKYAIATFLAGNSNSHTDEDDNYFIATRILNFNCCTRMKHAAMIPQFHFSSW